LLAAITNYRDGAPTEDDTLFVEVYRPLKSAPTSSAEIKPKTAAAPVT
jgi:hypothetical protein